MRIFTRRAPGLVLIATLLLLPGLASADTTLRLVTGGVITTAPEFELVSAGEGMPTLGLVGGLVIDENFQVEVGLHYAATQAEVFFTHRAGLRLLTLELTAGYHQPLWQVLGASVRLGLFGDLGRLQLQVSGGEDRYRGWAAGFGLVALGGLEIRSPAPDGKMVRFGLEAGYRWRPTAMPFDSLKLKSAREDPEVERIEIDPIDAGSLRLSGVMVQLTAGLSF